MNNTTAQFECKDGSVLSWMPIVSFVVTLIIGFLNAYIKKDTSVTLPTKIKENTE